MVKGVMTASAPKSRSGWLRRLPLVLVAVAALTGLGLALTGRAPGIEDLARHHETLTALRDAHYAQVVAGFMVIYVVMVALSLPGATLASLTGGFLFGLFPGVLINAGSAATGAVLLFLAARAGLGAETAARVEAAGGRGAALMAGLRRNQWPVLMAMRLAPVVPFFLANLLPAFAGVGLVPFAVTTAVGILPGALILTAAGAGLGEVFAKGGLPDLSILRDRSLILALAGLAVLVLVPVVLRWRRSARRRGGG